VLRPSGSRGLSANLRDESGRYADLARRTDGAVHGPQHGDRGDARLERMQVTLPLEADDPLNPGGPPPLVALAPRAEIGVILLSVGCSNSHVWTPVSPLARLHRRTSE
jgi:hypothetical protein